MDRAALSDAIARYFSGEKAQGWVWLAVGIAMATAGVTLLRTRTEYRAMGWPLVVVALIQIGAGLWLIIGSDKRIASFAALADKDAAAVARDEAARLAKVVTTFMWLKIAWLVIFAVGVALTFTMKHRSTWYAVGTGLALQMPAMLMLDLFAARRADHYLAALRQLTGG